jgi:hypothetical protein
MNCPPTLTEALAPATSGQCFALGYMAIAECGPDLVAVLTNTGPMTYDGSWTCYYGNDGGTLIAEYEQSDSQGRCWGPSFPDCLGPSSSNTVRWKPLECAAVCREPSAASCPESSPALHDAGCVFNLRRADDSRCSDELETYTWVDSLGVPQACAFATDGGALIGGGFWSAPSDGLRSRASDLHCWGRVDLSCAHRTFEAQIPCDAG